MGVGLVEQVDTLDLAIECELCSRRLPLNEPLPTLVAAARRIARARGLLYSYRLLTREPLRPEYLPA